MTLLFWALGNAMNEKKTARQLNIVTTLVKAGADHFNLVLTVNIVLLNLC